MKSSLPRIFAASTLALCLAPFAESAYMEGGKPVTKRHEAPAKTIPEKKPAEKNTAPEKTPPKKETSTAETKPQATEEKTPAAKAVPVAPAVTSAKSKPHVPEKKLATAPLPPARPKERAPEPAGYGNEKSSRTTAPSFSKPSAPRVPVLTKKSRPKNSVGAYAFAGWIDSDPETDLGGIAFEYRRIIADSRCDDCSLGNVLFFSAKLGVGIGSSDGEHHDNNYYYDGGSRRLTSYDEVVLGFSTVGLYWKHQLGKRVAFSLGVFGGLEYVSVEWTTRRHEYYYDYYDDYDSYDSSSSESASAFSLCYGVSIALPIDFNDRHGIELGVDLYKSDNKLDDAPGWDKPSGVMVRLGYHYSF